MSDKNIDIKVDEITSNDIDLTQVVKENEGVSPESEVLKDVKIEPKKTEQKKSEPTKVVEKKVETEKAPDIKKDTTKPEAPSKVEPAEARSAKLESSLHTFTRPVTVYKHHSFNSVLTRISGTVITCNKLYDNFVKCSFIRNGTIFTGYVHIDDVDAGRKKKWITE